MKKSRAIALKVSLKKMMKISRWLKVYTCRKKKSETNTYIVGPTIFLYYHFNGNIFRLFMIVAIYKPFMQQKITGNDECGKIYFAMLLVHILMKKWFIQLLFRWHSCYSLSSSWLTDLQRPIAMYFWQNLVAWQAKFGVLPSIQFLTTL